VDLNTLDRELRRCDSEKARLHEYGHSVAWIMAMGEADWEAEKYLLRKEYANGTVRQNAPEGPDLPA